MRLLLVEDEPRIAEFVAKGLREQSFAVDIAGDGEQGSYLATVNDYDLVILDVLLPVKDGRTLCRELRREGFRGPVLMMTGCDSVDNRIAGLDAGADDYLCKPFDLREMLARIRALLRRPHRSKPEVIRISDLILDTGSHCVSRRGRAINLTAKEYALLEFLVARRNRIVDRSEIARHVWYEEFDPVTNLIDVYIRRIRTKIDAGYEHPFIRTLRGEGYTFSTTADASTVLLK